MSKLTVILIGLLALTAVESSSRHRTQTGSQRRRPTGDARTPPQRAVPAAAGQFSEDGESPYPLDDSMLSGNDQDYAIVVDHDNAIHFVRAAHFLLKRHGADRSPDLGITCRDSASWYSYIGLNIAEANFDDADREMVMRICYSYLRHAIEPSPSDAVANLQPQLQAGFLRKLRRRALTAFDRLHEFVAVRSSTTTLSEYDVRVMLKRPTKARVDKDKAQSLISEIASLQIMSWAAPQARFRARIFGVNYL